MLGYVQNKTKKDWEAAIRKAIENKKASLSLIELSSESAINVFDHEWTSHHQKISANEKIIFYHILLDFTCS